MAALQPSLSDPDFENWVKSGLSLQYTKDGLENFVDTVTNNLQLSILNTLPSGITCTNCTTENVIKCERNNNFCKFANRACQVHDPNNINTCYRPCPLQVCHKIRDEIIAHHRYGKPAWQNTDARQWCRNRWKIAVCYMSSGYSQKTSTSDTDLPGILSVVINNTYFQTYVADNLSDDNSVFRQTRTSRNEILHNPKQRLTDVELQAHIATFTAVLSDTKSLSADPNAIAVITKLQQISNNAISITSQHAGQILADAFNSIQGAVDDVKELKETIIKSITEKMNEIDRVSEEALKYMKDAIKFLKEKDKEITDNIKKRGEEAIQSITDVSGAMKEKSNEIEKNTLERIAKEAEESLDGVKEKSDEIEKKAFKRIVEKEEESIGAMKKKEGDFIESIAEKTKQLTIEHSETLNEKKNELVAEIANMSNTYRTQGHTDLSTITEAETHRAQESAVIKVQTSTIQKTIDPIPENIKGQHVLVIETWRKDESTFIETHAATSLLDTINKTKCVTVTGNSGSGKSAAAHHVALQLGDIGYTIIPINDIADIQRYCDVSRKQVFVLDDPIGTDSLNESALVNSKSASKTILELLTSSDTKIMVTCRKIIVQNPKFAVSKSFLQNSIFDMRSEKHILSEYERKLILESHFKHLSKRLTADTKAFVVQQNSEQFPMLCQMFGANKKYQELGKMFFTNTFNTMVREIHSLQQNDKLKYFCLVLCLLFDNGFDTRMLNPFADTYKVEHAHIRSIMEACGVQTSTPMQDIKYALKSLQNVYLIQEGTRFRFMHDSLYEATACQFGIEYPIEVLNHCSSRFISERIRIAPFKGNDDSHFIVLDEEYTDILSKRLVLELERGNFHDVFISSFIEDKVIQENIIDVFRTYSADEIYRYAFDIDINVEKYDEFVDQKGDDYLGKLYVLQDRRLKMFHWLLAQNMSLVFRFIYEKIKHHKRYSTEHIVPIACLSGNIELTKDVLLQGSLSETFTFKDTLLSTLDMAVLSNNPDMVRYVMHTSDVSISMWDVSSLHIAAYNGSIDIISVLLQHGADVNLCNNNGVSPLYIAALNAHVEVVSVLLQHGADVNLCKHNGVSPLYIAAHHGHVEIVSVLVQHGADVKLCHNDGASPLYIAAQNGHVEVVSVLVQHGADVNLCRNDGVSPLYIAAQNGHVEVVSVLVQHGADVNLCDNDGVSPLYMAAQNGHVEVVSVLVQHGADVNLCRNDGVSPLYAAAHNGHVEVVSVLVQHGADVNLCRNDGVSPLYIAAGNGHVEVVSVLIQHGADVNLCRNDGVSPLYIAAEIGHVEVVSVLIQHGADVNLCRNNGASPLIPAAYNGHVEVVSVLVQHGADVKLCGNDGASPLHMAAQNGHVEVVSVLVQHGADVNMCTNDGVSPLYIASHNGHVEVVSVLIQHDSNVNLRDNNGVSPLYIAALNAHVEVVSVLLQHGADVNLCKHNGVSPLYIAAHNGHVEIVSVLVQHGADVKLCRNDGASPLYMAAQNGHVEVVSVLVQHGADVNLCRNDGVSPLYITAENGHVEVVSVLVQHGADVNLCDNDGVSPLYMAAQNGHVEVVSVLVQHGADVNLCRNDGVSPLYIAAENGHVEVVSVLIQHGADVNLCRNDGVSPLYIAAENGHVEVVSVLIQHGADVNLCRNNGASPLIPAAYNGHVEVVSVLVQHGADVNMCTNDGVSPLYIASHNGHVEVVSVLIQHDSNVNLRDNEGVSPLFMAVQNNHLEVVSVLIKHNADVNLCDNDGKSPLYIAAANGYVKIVYVLIVDGADDKLCNKNGASPLYLAAQEGHEEVVSELIKHRADVNKCITDCVSPLIIAAYYGHEGIVQKLLHSNADANIVDKDGDTALTAATDQGHTNIVEMFQKYLQQNR